MKSLNSAFSLQCLGMGLFLNGVQRVRSVVFLGVVFTGWQEAKLSICCNRAILFWLKANALKYCKKNIGFLRHERFRWQ